MRNGTSSYQFDPIAKRLSEAVPAAGSSPAQNLPYQANALNQYTSIAPLTRSTPAIPAIPATPAFDLDGNLTDDGDGTTFEWNADSKRGGERRRTTLASPGGCGAKGMATHQNRMVHVEKDDMVMLNTFDANGNISEYINLANGDIDAHMEYDAFGRKIVDETYNNFQGHPYGFSTKYEDTETGYLYYGYRFYDPQSGRWPNRDPIEEQGGYNLYGFVGNNSILSFDILGLLTYKWTVSGVVWSASTSVHNSWMTLVGASWGNSRLIMTNTEVGHIHSVGRDAGPREVRSRVFRIFYYFDAKGCSSKIKCPCPEKSDPNETYEGVDLYHVHMMIEQKEVKVQSVSMGGKVGGPEGEASAGITFTVNPKERTTAFVISFDVCPDGEGGYITRNKYIPPVKNTSMKYFYYKDFPKISDDPFTNGN